MIIRSPSYRFALSVALVGLSSSLLAQALSPYGVSVDSVTKSSLATWGPQMSAAGIKSVRGFHLFSTIEPSQGTWSWTAADKMMNDASANNLAQIGMLGLNAKWINTNTQTFPTANLPAWSTYVSTTVNHCMAKVKYWEVWNEPPNFTSNTGTPTDYASVVVSAYDAAKSADPNCKVGLAAKSADINWLDQTLVAGAVDHFDFITLHPYEVFDMLDQGWDAEYMNIVRTVRKMLAVRNPAKLNVPIIFTEIGEPVGGTVTPTMQAQDLIKAYAMGLAQGVTQLDWFEGKDGDSGAFGLVDSSGTPRPAYTAMSQFIQYFGQAPVYQGWVLLNSSSTPKRDHGFVFQGANNTIMAAWAPPGVTDTIAFSSPVTVVDPVTGVITPNLTSYPLSSAPVFIVGIPAPLLSQARINRNLSFPWDDSYPSGNSVKIVTGTPNTETGLHQYKPDVTSSAVTTPYGAARYCGLAATQTFSVDPNFFSYTTAPITITVVSRRDENNTSAGFNLRYESISGYKNSSVSWYTIPGNTQWYTKVFTINDAQFVGKYGFNFRFESDSTVNSKYYLQSVTLNATLPAAPATNIAASSFNLTQGTASLTLPSSLVGHTYQMQRNYSLASDSWSDVGAMQAGGGTLNFNDTPDPQQGRVNYRVLIGP